MLQLNMLAHQVREMSFSNKLNGEQSVKLKTTVQYGVKFQKGQNRCLCDAVVRVFDAAEKDLLAFRVHTMTVYEFQADELTEEIKKEIHVRTYAELYPKWRKTMSEFSVLTGGPAFEIPDLPINTGNVVAQQ